MSVHVRNFIVALLIAAAVFFFCLSSAETAAARKNIEFSLKETRISGIEKSGLTLSFLVELTNNSSRHYGLVSYDYTVLINDKEYFRHSVSLDIQIELPAGQKTVISFPVRINYNYLEPFITANSRQASCRLAGEMVFQDERKKSERLSFALKSEFPIFRLPEIKFLPLLVRGLTIGGADFDFRFSLNNPNPYDLLIQKIFCELSLAGRLVYQGFLPGDKALAAGESKAFTLPLMLDFFEQGRELRDEMEKDRPAFSLKLKVEADSAWGWLVFNLELSHPVDKEFRR
ncbi:MAG: LEA type 2 family protein [Candidatus Saccharicenans sp.]|nr:LEA type 2 family protein [Candidatus Saccharicenans sp.]